MKSIIYKYVQILFPIRAGGGFDLGFRLAEREQEMLVESNKIGAERRRCDEAEVLSTRLIGRTCRLAITFY